MNASRDNAPNDCELNISDGVHCSGFYDLQEKEGNGFNCEQLSILCVIRCHGI